VFGVGGVAAKIGAQAKVMQRDGVRGVVKQDVVEMGLCPGKVAGPHGAGRELEQLLGRVVGGIGHHAEFRRSYLAVAAGKGFRRGWFGGTMGVLKGRVVESDLLEESVCLR